MKSRPDRRWVGVSLSAAAVLVVAAGCSGSARTSESAPTVTTTVTRTVVAPPPPAPKHTKKTSRTPSSLTTFSGTYFDIDYPSSWSIISAEQQKSAYLDTTIQPPNNSDLVIRVDVSPGGAKPDLVADMEPLREAEHANPGYQEIDFSPTTYLGYPAQRWEFVADYQGVLLHEVDTFFNQSGDGYGVLVGAPASEWERWKGVFSRVRASLVVGGSVAPQPEPAPTPPPPPPTSTGSNCDPSYTGACLDPSSPDYDCAGGSGDGPDYVEGPVTVLGDDHFGLDADGDGIGCDS
jgi:hypothetical protein